MEFLEALVNTCIWSISIMTIIKSIFIVIYFPNAFPGTVHGIVLYCCGMLFTVTYPFYKKYWDKNQEYI
jgi:hypothetical protein